jgi:hypothetical protein
MQKNPLANELRHPGGIIPLGWAASRELACIPSLQHVVLAETASPRIGAPEDEIFPIAKELVQRALGDPPLPAPPPRVARAGVAPARAAVSLAMEKFVLRGTNAPRCGLREHPR